MKAVKIEELIEATYNPDSKERKAAARELCPCEIKAYIPEIWDRLIELADDPDDDVRKIVLHTLIDGSPRQREQDIVASIEKFQRDQNVKISRQAKTIYARYQRTRRINQKTT